LRYYLDSSAIIPLFKYEVASPAVGQWIAQNPVDRYISQLCIGEVRSAFSRQIRMGDWDAQGAATMTVNLFAWVRDSVTTVAHLDSDTEAASRMVAEPFPKLLMPDAIHIAVCKRLGLTLVTLDLDLLLIAIREGVNAVSPA
jgi:uncharacterized protein